MIVGFPGETDDMWHKTIEFIRNAQFDDVHLFRFSPRPNTIAASLPNPVAPDVKHVRWNEAESLIQSIQKERLSHHVGKSFHVLWESAVKSLGDSICWQGYSENYLKFLRWFDDKPMRGEITDACFTESDVELNCNA